MGKLINYFGKSEILKRIADVLNVTDVQMDGVSIVDSNGIANVPDIPPLTVQNGKLCIIYDDGQ